MRIERAERKRAAARDGVQGAAAEKDVSKSYHHPAPSSRGNLQLELGELALSLVRSVRDEDRAPCLQFLESTAHRQLRPVPQVPVELFEAKGLSSDPEPSGRP